MQLDCREESSAHVARVIAKVSFFALVALRDVLEFGGRPVELAFCSPALTCLCQWYRLGGIQDVENLTNVLLDCREELSADVARVIA